MKLEYRSGLFLLQCEYSDAELVRRAGFVWLRNHHVWATPFAQVAARIRSLLTPAEKETILSAQQYELETEIQSKATGALFKVPAPGNLAYLPYQLAGIRFMAHRRNVLLADQMGLGKTIQVLGLCNLLLPKSVLIVCPASVKLGWFREWTKWTTTDLSVDIAEGGKFPASDVVIINYDILSRNHAKIRARNWEIAAFDECHYLKNADAKRTQHVVGGKTVPGIKAARKIALSGTPFLNRPIELYPILRYLLPYGWTSKMAFATRYCAAVQGHFGWDFTGASHLDELQQRLRSTIMIRRLKADVLKDLPPKVRQIIEVNPDQNTKAAVSRERALWNRVIALAGVKDETELSEDQFKDVIALLQGGSRISFEEMSKVRKETALAKVPLVVEHLKESTAASGKVVCFCHHKEVARILHETFGTESVMLTGSSTMTQRQLAVDNFQQDPRIKLFIGNIQAAGTGITLTAASHVVFAELSWVPGELSQAEDRCHRIGTKNSVLIQHLVIEGSIEATMAKALVRKQEVLDQTLNKQAVDWSAILS